MSTINPSQADFMALLADIFYRKGSNSYLGEPVTMSEHMLQCAAQAEQAEESDAVVTACFLHDIGHYVQEFPEEYIRLELDNRHERAGADLLEQFFPMQVTEPVRWHVQAKRYLCTQEDSYFQDLSDASVQSLAWQGGPLSADEARSFEDNPHLDSIIRVRRYDDAAKVPGVKTPPISHFIEIARRVLENHRQPGTTHRPSHASRDNTEY